MDMPHYLRFARTLALLSTGSGALLGCASQVNTNDGAVTDTGADTAVADTGSDAPSSCSTTCPATQPTNGTACGGMSCSYTQTNGLPTQCECLHADAGTCGTFMCYTAVPGPLLPPELA